MNFAVCIERDSFVACGAGISKSRDRAVHGVLRNSDFRRFENGDGKLSFQVFLETAQFVIIEQIKCDFCVLMISAFD